MSGNGENRNLESLLHPNLHPNRISLYGTALTLTSLAMLSFETTRCLAPLFYGVGAVCDYMDGRVAKRYNLRTIEGAKIDPMMDKIKNVAVGIYMMGRESVEYPGIAASNIANFIVDLVSQRNRGPISEQIRDAYVGVVYPSKCNDDNEKNSKIRANYYGKIKTVIQSAVHASYITVLAWGNQIGSMTGINPGHLEHGVKKLAIYALFTSAALGAVGIVKRIRKS